MKMFLLLPLPSGEGWGEGLYCFSDLQQYGFEVLQHVTVTKSQCVNTMRYQECLTLFVVLYAYARVMLSTIQFDTELAFVAVEVKDVRTHRILTPKLQTTELSIPQTVPQEFFCVGLVTTQLAHKCEVVWGQSGFHGDPHPRPLPEGEGTKNSPGQALRHCLL
jgi:hypothetical protein